MDKIQLRSVDLRKLIVSDFSTMFEPSQLVGQILSINSILVILFQMPGSVEEEKAFGIGWDLTQPKDS